MALGRSGSEVWFHTFLAALISTFVAIGCALPFLDEKATPETFRIRQIGIAVIFLAFVGFWVWFQQWRPRRGALTVCEQGFSCKGQRFRFDDVASIQPGKELGGFMSAVKTANQALGRVDAQSRGVAERAKIAHDATVTVNLKDGGRKPLNALMIRYEPDDLRRFFELIAARRPEIRLDLRPTA